MSRVGKQSVKITAGVTAKLNGSLLEVKGPKGSLRCETFGRVNLKQIGDECHLLKVSGIERSSAYWGLYRALLFNMVKGVSEGFSKTLEIQGTGYRAAVTGKELSLTVGYSHPVKLSPPEGIHFEVDKTGKVIILGIDKELVGQVAAKIRSIRAVEPYQGKGIRYLGETVVTKVGKSAGKK